MKLVPAFCVGMKVTFGTEFRKSAGVVMPLARMSAAVNAVSWAGRSWMSSERWRAVTTTVSIASSAKAGAVATNSAASAVPQASDFAKPLV